VNFPSRTVPPKLKRHLWVCRVMSVVFTAAAMVLIYLAQAFHSPWTR
jgi:hypothetical protein